jgi:putative oxidoreductase
MSERGKKFVALFVRLTLGVCFTVHGVEKVFDGGAAELASTFDAHGFPAPVVLAWAVAFAELFAGITMLIGFFTTVSALIVIGLMAGAIVLHWNHGYSIRHQGFEYHVALIALALASIALGPGMLAYRLQFKKEEQRRP